MIKPLEDDPGSIKSIKTPLMSLHDVKRIGLMADSHGDLDSLKSGIHRLEACGVDAIIHLGDFLDSQQSDNALGIIETFYHKKIFTVKGNNDYQIETALRNGCLNHIPTRHRKKILSFLTSVPIILTLHNICFAHSLPYNSIRSFYEPVDTGNADRARMIFQNTIYHILFCGHSHFPILFRNHSGKVVRETIQERLPINIIQNERFIIIVGSVEKGESGLMDIKEMKYERIRL
jgi:predicted phosphodiesterase